MNIYLLTQNTVTGYDTYDSIVVSAKNEEDARMLHPRGGKLKRENKYPVWALLKDKGKINVELLGEAKEGTEEGVILASFNAG